MSLGHTLLVLAVYAFASARVTRIINADTILEPLRYRVAKRSERAQIAADEAAAAGESTRAADCQKHAKRWVTVYDWMGCPWCAGQWVAIFGAIPAVWIIKYNWTLDWWAVIPLALAASHLIGMGARFVQGD